MKLDNTDNLTYLMIFLHLLNKYDDLECSKTLKILKEIDSKPRKQSENGLNLSIGRYVMEQDFFFTHRYFIYSEYVNYNYLSYFDTEEFKELNIVLDELKNPSTKKRKMLRNLTYLYFRTGFFNPEKNMKAFTLTFENVVPCNVLEKSNTEETIDQLSSFFEKYPCYKPKYSDLYQIEEAKGLTKSECFSKSVLNAYLVNKISEVTMGLDNYFETLFLNAVNNVEEYENITITLAEDLEFFNLVDKEVLDSELFNLNQKNGLLNFLTYKQVTEGHRYGYEGLEVQEYTADAYIFDVEKFMSNY